MAARDEELLKRLLLTFAGEAQEHLDGISAGLLALEQRPSPERRQELVEATFREIHTLKGAARAVNLPRVVEICHDAENLFAILKRDRTALSTELLDLLHELFSLVKELLPGSSGSSAAGDEPRQASLLARLAEAKSLLQSGTDISPAAESDPESARSRTEPAEKPPTEFVARQPGQSQKETIRLSLVKLDRLLRQAEELVSAKQSMAQQAADLAAFAAELDDCARIRVRDRLRSGEVRAAQAFGSGDVDGRIFRKLADRAAALSGSAKHELRSFGKMLDNMIEETKQILMAPISALMDPLPQSVRDLSRAQGKEIDLVIEGDDLEIDRRIQDEMRDALLHLLRNAVDHGIEAGAQRRAQGKPPRGRITITIGQRDSGRAEIRIADDGAGIDLTRVRQAAQRLGVAAAESQTQENGEDTLPLIFLSGLSTSQALTDLSGRGLGLAIVQEKVEKLGGTISVASSVGAGTQFTIVLPFVIASFRGVLVEAGGAQFVLPTRQVERVARVPADEITTVENRETVTVGGRVYSLVWMRDILGLSNGGPDENAAAAGGYRHVVLLSWAGTMIAFVVDAIRDEREILMKGLGRQLVRVRNVAGATVLPTGEIALILDIQDLMKSAAAVRAPSRSAAPSLTRKSILVAEDSITARTLFKHVLEAAGYRVKTAVDGLDAWMSLGDDTFDLVVSDVEMPKMDGFELTARIRNDQKLAKLPVILVTSLGSREDRERGIDAGASAYIVKDSFDQNSLLRIVGSLI